MRLGSGWGFGRNLIENDVYPIQLSRDIEQLSAWWEIGLEFAYKQGHVEVIEVRVEWIEVKYHKSAWEGLGKEKSWAMEEVRQLHGRSSAHVEPHPAAPQPTSQQSFDSMRSDLQRKLQELYRFELMPKTFLVKFRQRVEGFQIGANFEVIGCLAVEYLVPISLRIPVRMLWPK